MSFFVRCGSQKNHAGSLASNPTQVALEFTCSPMCLVVSPCCIQWTWLVRSGKSCVWPRLNLCYPHMQASVPRIHIKKPSQVWERLAIWSTYPVNSCPVRDTVSKIRWMTPEKQALWLKPGLNTHTEGEKYPEWLVFMGASSSGFSFRDHRPSRNSFLFSTG